MRSRRADVPYGLWPGISIMPRSMAGIREWAERVPDRSAARPAGARGRPPGAAMRPLLPVARLAEAGRPPSVRPRSSSASTSCSPRRRRQPPLPIGACEGLSSWETDKAIVAACPYAWPWNVLGWPGISVPAGFTEAGLPIGAQLLGPANSEPRLLSLAAQLEAEERWFERRPAQFGDGETRKTGANAGENPPR